ncbi:Pentatricopeptide repeat-containing protein [Zostera marina]|uniref:Pentatricopeptide repeat-containing protein n=1 Tax=Zostera marina TaxID=29655 RepID=A0A0K9PCG5_ZOSMR|nr:Pentatricopeptide repeat-containing protein [Zostera marina]
METPLLSASSISRPLLFNPDGRRSQNQISISHVLRRNPNLSHIQLKQVHGRLFRLNLHEDDILVTKLVSVCSQNSTVSYALRLFHFHPSPDLILFNSLLKTLLPNDPFQVLVFFIRNVALLHPDAFTYPYLLKACGAVSNVQLGTQFHGRILKAGLGNDFVLSSLAHMYFKCGDREMAIRVLKASSVNDVASWNVMLNGFLGVDDIQSLLHLFRSMPVRDVVSWNTVLTAYTKFGRMEDAQRMFDSMPTRNLVSWNGLIAGYVRAGDADKALELFSLMLSQGIQPDAATMLSVASACRSSANPDGSIIDQIATFVSSKETVNSLLVSTVLLSLYSRVGRLEDARSLFDRIPEKDLVSWNSMIGGYSQNQRPTDAIDLFRLMQKQEHVKPDGVTMSCLIDACSHLGALGLGEWIHAYMNKNNIEMDAFLATALVDMYAKCGDLKTSRLLFSEIPNKDLVCWNAMMKGLAVHGQGEEALELFSQMEKEGMSPNEVTFIALLSACSHGGGLVPKGLEIFRSMQEKYDVTPGIKHYGCVVDLLGRAGRIEEAFEFVENMSKESVVKPDSIVWGALLGACSSHENIQFAQVAASRLLELEPVHDGNYILLSNVYATKGKWDDVEKVRARMRSSNVRKEAGCSMIELNNGEIHEFRAGDKSHPRWREIYQAWDELLKVLRPMGYEPDTKALLKNLEEEEEKEEALFRHSEKLALSLALIDSSNSKSTAPIRIVKNLRICGDCHRAMEVVSQIVKDREIIVRDRNRFHHFIEGSCSCGGYW